MMSPVRLCLISTALLLTTGPGLADEVLGTWLRDNGALKIKFEPCGDAVCGNIVWLKPDFESKAKIGQRLFFDVHPDGANSWTGKVAPNDGSIYLGKMSIERAALKICTVDGLICRSTTW